MLTGDTLFIGDVGPPRPAGLGRGHRRRARRHALRQPARPSCSPLPDATRVFPAHGAGSACGKNLSDRDAVDHRRAAPRQLRARRRWSVTRSSTWSPRASPSAPGYFAFDAASQPPAPPAARRRRTRPSRCRCDGSVAARDAGRGGPRHPGPGRVRHGHLRGSINVGLDGRFAEYAGSVAAPDDRIVLVVRPRRRARGQGAPRPHRLRRRGRRPRRPLRRHGRPPRRGRGGQPAHRAGARRGPSVAGGTASRSSTSRNPGETAGGTVPGARTVPLARLRQQVDDLDPARPHRRLLRRRVPVLDRCLPAAVPAASRDVSDLVGGYGAWETVGAE